MLSRWLTGEGYGGTMDDDAALRRLVEDERARYAATDRGVTRRLREQAAEESTIAGTLLDLAEAGVGVGVRTTSGRLHQGVVRGVGGDFCALRLGSGRWLYVAAEAVASVRVEAGVGDGDPGTRHDVLDRRLEEVLALLAPERPRVMVWSGTDPDPVVGELRAVGIDLVTVRLDGPRRAACHVRLGAVSEVAVDVG